MDRIPHSRMVLLSSERRRELKLQYLGEDLAHAPMGSYDVRYYQRGRLRADSDGDVNLAYVERAARTLGPDEGMVAVCRSQTADPLVVGWVPEER